jgi:hypothetical protein
MIEIREANAEDAPRVLPLLREFRNPYIRDDQWRRLFEDPWGTARNRFGHLMLDDGTAVGFFGALESERRMGGQWRRIRHFTSWIVRPGYRNRILLLLAATLREKDAVLADLTPSPEVYALLSRAGFRDFETAFRVLFPVHPFAGSGGLVFDPAEIEPRLDPEQARILRDHRFPGCRHAWFEADGRACYLVFNRLARRRPPFRLASLLYASDREGFREHAGRLVSPLCRHLKVAALFSDERFLAGRTVPLSVTRALRRPRVFRADPDAAGELDGLYSEFPVLEI